MKLGTCIHGRLFGNSCRIRFPLVELVVSRAYLSKSNTHRIVLPLFGRSFITNTVIPERFPDPDASACLLQTWTSQTRVVAGVFRAHPLADVFRTRAHFRVDGKVMGEF